MLRFQMESFPGSTDVTNSVETGDGVFVVKSSGEFGRVTVDEDGVCSFQRLGKSKYKSQYTRRHFLFQN